MLHMAYGRVDFEFNLCKQRKLRFTDIGDTDELIRHLRPAVQKRIKDARIIRQRAAARS